MKTCKFLAGKGARPITGVSNVERYPNIWFIVKRCVQKRICPSRLAVDIFAVGRDN